MRHAGNLAAVDACGCEPKATGVPLSRRLPSALSGSPRGPLRRGADPYETALRQDACSQRMSGLRSAALRKFDDFRCDCLSHVLGAVAGPQSDSGHFEVNPKGARGLWLEPFAAKIGPDRHPIGHRAGARPALSRLRQGRQIRGTPFRIAAADLALRGRRVEGLSAPTVDACRPRWESPRRLGRKRRS
jgi:hypothetical protein